MRITLETVFTLMIVAIVGLGCSSFRASDSPNANTNTTTSNVAATSPKPTAADCPSYPLTVNDLKNKQIEKYSGCLLSVSGKLWDITATTATLIDSNERTDYNGALYVGGSFSSATYSELGLRLSTLKSNQQFDRLPTVTMTGSVEERSGHIGLSNAVLSGIQK